MRGLGEVDRNSEAAREDAEAGDVVLMLMSDKDCVECGWIFSGEEHASTKLAARETCINEDAGSRRRDDSAVSLGAGGEHSHAHHALTIRRRAVEIWDRGISIGSCNGRGNGFPSMWLFFALLGVQ
jgi:hypothetical protein